CSKRSWTTSTARHRRRPIANTSSTPSSDGGSDGASSSCCAATGALKANATAAAMSVNPSPAWLFMTKPLLAFVFLRVAEPERLALIRRMQPVRPVHRPVVGARDGAELAARRRHDDRRAGGVDESRRGIE